MNIHTNTIFIHRARTYLSLPDPEPLELVLPSFSLADSLPDSFMDPVCKEF